MRRKGMIAAFLREGLFVALVGAATSPLGAVVVDFETIASDTLVRDQFLSIGLRVSGAGEFSGRVISEGQYDVWNFGNSPTQIVHAGYRSEPTTFRFVDPDHPDSVIGAEYIQFRAGDGNTDSETFEVTYLDTSGAVLNGPTQYTTAANGLVLGATSADLGALIGYVQIMVVPASVSGVTLDDLEFVLAPTPTGIRQTQISDYVTVRAYPNPFNPITSIAFELKTDETVALQIYDVHGQLVRRMVAGRMARGGHEFPWNGRDDGGRTVSSGVYFVRLDVGARVLTRKIVLEK